MTTAQDVFDIAMGLMDEVNESNGQTDTPDTREYKVRTLLILTPLLYELFPHSRALLTNPNATADISLSEKYRLQPKYEPDPIPNFATPIDLIDTVAKGVMPYGLAAQLLLDENPAAASFLQQRYEELVRSLSQRIPAQFEAIEDIYGGIGFREFGRW